MGDLTKSDGGDGRNNYMLEWLDAHASGPLTNEGAPASNGVDQEFAGRLYQLCLRALQDFCHQQRDQRSSKSRLNVLRECLGRFYLWGEPFGVGKLDKALRQSDELRDSVLERLGYIGKLLLRKSKPSNHQPTKQIKELQSAIKQGKLIVSRDHNEIPQHCHEDNGEYDSGGEGSSDSGSYDTIDDIGFATTCLLELGPSVQQNLVRAETAQDRRSCLTSVPFSVSGPATIYVKLVREKFKQAHDKLVERLGEANWQRHKDVRAKMENPEVFPEESTKAGSLFRPYSDFYDSGIGTSVPTQTEYALSHSSFQSSNIEGERASLRVPREPSEVGAGKPFQCFLCRCIVTNVRNGVDWKMHVFADLRPYICTFPDCKDELAQFTNRAAWADHEFTEHRYDGVWYCPECSEKLASASDWEQHLQKMHQRVFTGPQLHVARDTAYQARLRPVETEECPLCCVVLGKPRRAFVKHIARHMEEIALMALPCSTGENSDEGSVITDEVCSVSGNAELLAAALVDLPGGTEKDPDEKENFVSPTQVSRGLINLGEPSDDGQQGEEANEVSSSMPPPRKSRTNTPWTPAEEQRLQLMRDAGNSWGEIAKVMRPERHHMEILTDVSKSFPNRTEGSVKKHWYKDMHPATRAAETQYKAREGTRVRAIEPSIFARPFPHLRGDEAEDYIIKCICGFQEDDGNTVYCDLCDTWQHTECYYYLDKHGDVPPKERLEVIDHLCADCHPRSLNAKGAAERQRIRKQFDQMIGKNDQMDKGSIAQPRGNARGKATVSPPKTPPNPTAAPYDELEDPAQSFLCRFVGCRRAHMEHNFQSHLNLSNHLKRVHGYSTLEEASNGRHSPSPSKFEGSGGFAGADGKKRREKVGPPNRCHSCNRAESPQWRRGPNGPKSLCNDCGLRYEKLTRKVGRKASASTGSSNLQSKKSSPQAP